MPIDDRTTNLSLPKPNAANLLEEDVARLREFADSVDLALNLRPLASAVTSQINAAVAGLASTSYVDSGLAGRVPTSRTVSAGSGLTGGGALTGNISLSLTAGAIASLALADTAVQPGRTIFTGAGLTGGGDLSANRTISPVIPDQTEAEAGTDNVKLMTALRTAQQIAAKPPGVPVVAKTAAYTLADSDTGKTISITTGGVTVPNGLAAGTTVCIWNNSATAQTITQGAGLTMYNANGGATGNRTLAGRGLCTVSVMASGVAIISGAGLS